VAVFRYGTFAAKKYRLLTRGLFGSFALPSRSKVIRAFWLNGSRQICFRNGRILNIREKGCDFIRKFIIAECYSGKFYPKRFVRFVHIYKYIYLFIHSFIYIYVYSYVYKSY
jgi:hypothetical protein